MVYIVGEMNVVEEIIKIETIQKERTSQNKLLKYNSGEKKHLKQIEFHKCIKKNRWVFGGNRSGKTECGAVEVIYFARGNHPYRKIDIYQHNCSTENNSRRKQQCIAYAEMSFRHSRSSASASVTAAFHSDREIACASEC